MAKRSYNLLTWVPHLFLFYKERVFRKLLPVMVIITLYEILVGLVFSHITRHNLGQFHLIFSFILTIIISFRVNSSYSRWWEGRTLWGAIVNNCRNLALKFDAYFGLETNPEFYHLLHKLPVVIKANLRKDTKVWIKELNELGFKGEMDINPVVLITQQLYSFINKFRDGSLDRMQQCALLEANLASLIDAIGGCDRIANTRMPPAFAYFVKQALLFYVLMFPFGWLNAFGYLIVPMMLMMMYILLGLEILSEELEEPFNVCDTGLNLDVICRTIQLNVEQIERRASLTGITFSLE